MPTTIPAPISRYFAADATRDTDALIALFAVDAVVIDEDKTWRGASEIRAWRNGPASAFQYTSEVLDVATVSPTQYVARVHIEGNFPGGTVDLHHRFTLDGAQISRLEIAP